MKPSERAATVARERGRSARRWRIVGPLMGLVWLVFLSEPLTAIETTSAVVRVLTVVGVLGVGAVFVIGFLVVGIPHAPVRVARRPALRFFVVLQLGFVALSCLGAHQHGLVGLVFVSVTWIYFVRSITGMWVALASALLAFLLPRVIPGWVPEDGTVAAVALASFAVYGFVQLVERNRQLLAAHEEVAALAVTQERERIARDVHDVLGHSLTVVAVKSELASRLVTLDPKGASRELLEIQTLVRSALADVRGTVAATRHVTLVGELAAARRALDAAGVEVELPGTVDDVPADLRELFAWAVRESTTNVLRHSGARHVSITLGAGFLVVEDDGDGPGAQAKDQVAGSPGGGPGRGLRGLSERASTAGAELETGPGPTGGFCLSLRRAAEPHGERL